MGPGTPPLSEMLSNLALLYEAPIRSVQLIIDGILIGAILALAAYGMALVWGVMNIINIAQGEVVMLGGYVTFFLAAASHLGWASYHARS